MEVFSLRRKEKVVIGRGHGRGLLGNRIVGFLDWVAIRLCSLCDNSLSYTVLSFTFTCTCVP